jgi:hypothetical protein
MPAARRNETVSHTIADGSGVQLRENTGRQNVMSAYRRMLCETTNPLDRQCIIELMAEEIEQRLQTDG